MQLLFICIYIARSGRLAALKDLQLYSVLLTCLYEFIISCVEFLSVWMIGHNCSPFIVISIK